MSRSRSDTSGNTPRPILAHPSVLQSQAISPSAPESPTPALRASEADEDALSPFEGSDQPTDDTPTIISRNTPRPPNAEEVVSDIRGMQLAHFELIEPIGVGGMAAVLRARDTQLDRLVALKILPPEMAADLENVRRFHQEARSAAKLDHENIARVFFCGEDQRLHFIAFEFVEGENLRAILERRGRLPVAEVVHYMLQVAAGLAHAAQRGVVHRDIKPSNIIITPTGRAKLVDMGLARSMEPQNDAGLTQSGVTLGTFDYISPEQALEPRDADIRSDIYSLGCTFFHCLTGRPPVPEGTAAKKLHHHQHVKPIDPRQLVPDLPDEIAIILDRMMAKNARDRFQSPEQLVDALLQAHRNLGSSLEVPEGVLSVEAAWPAQPSGRPLLMIGLAAAAVIALVLVLDQAPVRRAGLSFAGRTRQADPRDKVTPTSTVGPAAVAPTEQTPAVQETNGQNVARYIPPEEPSVKHLVDWLQQNQFASRIEIYLAGVLDVSARDSGAEQGLLVQAKQQVIIRPKPGSRPTLRFQYDGKAGKGPRVALTVSAPKILVEGVRFVVDLHESPGTEMVGLQLQGGTTHRVERCEFIQAQPYFHESRRLASDQAEPDRSRLTSVLIDSNRSRPEVSIRECAFLGFGKLTARPSDREGQPDELIFSKGETGGQDAVVRKGPAELTVENCVFGPHASVVHLEGSSEREPPKLLVKNCSVLAGWRSSVFDVAEEASGDLEMINSVVSRLGIGPSKEEHGAVLIRQAEGTRGGSGVVNFQGNDNRYHNLDGYWSVGDAWQKAGWGDFRRRMHEGGVQDDSRVLLRNPWKLETRRQLDGLERDPVYPVFQLHSHWSAVRQLSRSTLPLLGVQRLLGDPCVPDPLPEVDKTLDEAGGRTLVVEKYGDDSTNGVYPDLHRAVQAATPGDVILIRHNGSLEIDPIRLDKKVMGDLIIRPWRAFRPVLTLGETSERDAALFRIHNGKLRLEELQFLLRPIQDEARVQTVVSLEGDGECFMKGCVATLDRNHKDISLALATLSSAGRLMKGDMLPTRTPDQGPRLVLDHCFIRGDGDLLWSRTSRPCELTARNSLAVLKGSLLNVEVPPEATAPPATQRVSILLSQVSTYLGNHLIRLGAGKEIKGLVPVQCSASACLFVPAGAVRALIHLDGPEIGEKALREKLEWKGGQNGYGAFAVLVDHRPPGDEMPQPAMGPERWKNIYGDDTSKFGLKVAEWPDADLNFLKMEPDQFKSPEDKVGTNVLQLPRPSALPVAFND